jgi:peptidyl-prolyl cis-trans isomerase A (cyclophilin A)
MSGIHRLPYILVSFLLLCAACERTPGETTEERRTAPPKERPAAPAEPKAQTAKSVPDPAEPKKAGDPPVPAPPSESAPHPALRDPSLANEQAPEVFRVRFQTSRGAFVIEAHRAWAPLGADRFYNLARIGFYDGTAFFRVIRDPQPFVAQFGISGDPEVTAHWMFEKIRDDPLVKSNVRGAVTFAKIDKDSRTTQIFINYADNSRTLDILNVFPPFGMVIEGMEVVDALYAGYGDSPTAGRGPLQGRILAEGNVYLKRDFPKLDYVERATILRD